MSAPTEPNLCGVALKEWSIACRALAEGRQILLIRKGGLLDAGGVFETEHPLFWLMPSKWHQDANLLKSAHHDLLNTEMPVPGRQIRLGAWASVARVWSLQPCDPNLEEKLARLEHIWSERYLDIRLGYQQDKPLHILALRVYVRAEPHIMESNPDYFGCKSWVDLERSWLLAPSAPVLDDETFAARLSAAERVLTA